jgi:preprotein translocase subunit SecD
MQKTSFLIFGLLLYACRPSPDPITVEFRIAQRIQSDSLTQMIYGLESVPDTFYVYPPSALTENEITSAEVTSMHDRPAIAVLFSERGADLMATMTRENVGKHLAIIVDGTLVSAPVIRAGISGGRAIINGDFTRQEARTLAERLDHN